MELKGAIFDFDGTLFDSMEIWENAGSEYIKSLGKQPEPGLDEILRPMSLYDSALYLSKRYGIDKSEREILIGIADLVEDFYFHKALPKPGIERLLDEMSRRGVRMAVATASERHHIEAALKRCNLDGYFCGIVTCGEVGSGKNEPDTFRKALELLKTERPDTLVFEDSYNAVMTSKADGFVTVVVNDRFERRRKEVEEAADYYFEDLEESEEFWRFVSEQ